jgi:hypothetical protein
MLDEQGLHACTRMHTPGCAYTHICNIYCFSSATIIFERASMLRYAYIACVFVMLLYVARRMTTGSVKLLSYIHEHFEIVCDDIKILRI